MIAQLVCFQHLFKIMTKKKMKSQLEKAKQKKKNECGGALCRAVTWPSDSRVCVLLTGTPLKNNVTGAVEYEMQGPLQYLVWYHAVGLIWITEFIFAFQQMTIAGAVVTYYFTRWGKNPPLLLLWAAPFRGRTQPITQVPFIVTTHM